MAQYNVNPPEDYRRDTGMGTVLAVLLVLALVAFLIWALAFGGFNSLTGASYGTSPSYTGGTTGTSGTTGGMAQPTIAPSTGAGGSYSGGSTAPTKP